MSSCRIDAAVSNRSSNSSIPRRPAKGARGDPAEPPPVSLLGPIVQDVVDSLLLGLQQLSAKVTAMHDQLDALRQQQENRDRLEAVVTDLHKRYSDLSEEFHQRETPGPVFHCLIAIADRCREKMRRLRSVATRETSDAALSAKLHDLIKARSADRIDAEQTLAILGVEPFRERNGAFNHKRQKVMQSVPTTDNALVGAVAKHLQPGYVRHGRVIRPELVAVYIKATLTKTGEKQCSQSESTSERAA